MDDSHRKFISINGQLSTKNLINLTTHQLNDKLHVDLQHLIYELMHEDHSRQFNMGSINRIYKYIQT